MTPVQCPACGWWHPQDAACARCAALGAPIDPDPMVLSGGSANSGAQEPIRHSGDSVACPADPLLIEPASANGSAGDKSLEIGTLPAADHGLGRPEPDDTRPVEPTGPYGQPETPIETPIAETITPEVGTLRKPSHGRGLILFGNPGNKGGRRHAEPIKAQLRRLLDLHGLPLLERVIRREEIDVRVDREGEAHHVPNSVGDAIRAVAVALAAAESRPAQEQLPVDPRHAGDAPRVWRFEPPLRIDRTG